jgi:SP family sugar porter-like MFS transporter
MKSRSMIFPLLALLACFILTYTFPLLNSSLGASGTFWLYGVICALGGAFIAKNLPETKGKTLEEIENDLAGNL